MHTLTYNYRVLSCNLHVVGLYFIRAASEAVYGYAAARAAGSGTQAHETGYRMPQTAQRFRQERGPSRSAGFTLIEMLIVMALIAMLAGMIMATYAGIVGRQRRAKAIVDIELIRKGLEDFYAAWGKYPPTHSFDGIDGPNRSLVYFLSRDCSKLDEGAADFLPANDPRCGPFIDSYILADKERFKIRSGARLWHDPWGNPYIYFERSANRGYTNDAPRYRITGHAAEDAGGTPVQPRKDDELLFYGTDSFQVWSCGPDKRTTFFGRDGDAGDGPVSRWASDDITSWDGGT